VALGIIFVVNVLSAKCLGGCLLQEVLSFMSYGILLSAEVIIGFYIENKFRLYVWTSIVTSALVIYSD
jgi:hypothetical protein